MGTAHSPESRQGHRRSLRGGGTTVSEGTTKIAAAAVHGGRKFPGRGLSSLAPRVGASGASGTGQHAAAGSRSLGYRCRPSLGASRSTAATQHAAAGSSIHSHICGPGLGAFRSAAAPQHAPHVPALLAASRAASRRPTPVCHGPLKLHAFPPTRSPIHGRTRYLRSVNKMISKIFNP